MNICQCISVHRQVFPEINLLKFMLHQRKLIILQWTASWRVVTVRDSGKHKIYWRETGFDCYLGGGIHQNLCTECRFFCLSVEKSYVLVATANQPGESSVVSSSYSSKPCLFSSNITLSSWLIQLDLLQTEFSGRSSTTNVTLKWSEKCVK